MKKLTDKELDSIFQNAAEGFQPPFDSSAWEAMNNKMNRARPFFWKRWGLLGLIGLVIFSFGVWVGTTLNEDENKESNYVVEKNAFARNEDSNTKSNPILSENFSEKVHETISTKTKNGYATGLKSHVKQNHNTVLIDKKIGHQETFIAISEDNNTMYEEDELQDNSSGDSQILSQINEKKDSSINTMSVLESPLVTDSPLEATKEEKDKKEKSIQQHSFYIRALISPDFSSIDFTSVSTIGSNYSLMVEYPFSQHFSVSTGAIWSMKKYAYDEEFTYGAYTADRLDGTCRIVDIPINFYYNMMPKSKFSISTGVGLSSYLMLHENYTYTYYNPSGNRSFSSSIDGKNNEWFKMLNLSAVLQYKIGEKLFIQSEPFVKIPLSGVGEWKVNLSSMGVFVGLKYRIN